MSINNCSFVSVSDIVYCSSNGDLDGGGGGGVVTWGSGINILWDFYIVSSSSQSFDLRFSTFSN